jgi:hypothetical protein
VPLKLGEGLLRETFATVRRCGARRNECVAYWAGPQNEPSLVDRVIHPAHTSTPGYYEIEPEWLNRIWFELHDEEIEIRAQVHTHRGRAFHSKLDDDFPFLQTSGFLSLVLPRFGDGEVGLEGAYLTELMPGGRWRELDAAATLEVS